MGKLSLVTAIYKNEGNILPFYENFIEQIAPFVDEYEIVMVNDCSLDNSWEIMKGLAAKDPNIKIIKLSRNFGAYEANFIGYEYATGDCITVKAVDLQEPAELTVSMYQAWKKGAKVVLAVRENRNDSAFTNLTSNLYYRIIQKMAQKNMPAGGFDTYLIDRQVADLILRMQERNSPISLQILWTGFEPVTVGYIRRKREIGKSSWSFEKKLKLAIDSLISFSYVPVRCMTMTGILFWFFSILYAVYLVAAKLLGKTDVPGYTTIVVILLFVSGMIMFTLGLLGEYIWRTLENTRKRPIAVIGETMNIDQKSSGKDSGTNE